MASIAVTPYFSHPWFDKPSMKRRHSSSSPEVEALEVSISPTSNKRRRVTALERGFSNLSLRHSQPFASTSSATIYSPLESSSISPPFNPILSAVPLSSSPSPFADPFTAMEVEYSSTTPSIQPDSVEEPTTPSLAVPEIRMKGSSWYEPEPDRESPKSLSVPQTTKSRFSGIVVTDLDSSEDEDEDGVEPDHPVVSPALLERIRQRELSNALPVPFLSDQHALVLYRPLPRPTPSHGGTVSDSTRSIEQDVEMMDVE